MMFSRHTYTPSSRVESQLPHSNAETDPAVPHIKKPDSVRKHGRSVDPTTGMSVRDARHSLNDGTQIREQECPKGKVATGKLTGEITAADVPAYPGGGLSRAT